MDFIHPVNDRVAYAVMAELMIFEVSAQSVSIRCVSSTQETSPAMPCGPVNRSIAKFNVAVTPPHMIPPPGTAKMLSF